METSCGYLFWVGVALTIAGIGMPFVLRPRLRPAGAGEPGSGPGTRRWLVPVSVLTIGVGLAISSLTMWNGNCVEVPGACPAPMTGTGYVCKSPGAACKVAGMFSGTCVTESSSIFNCECQCR